MYIPRYKHKSNNVPILSKNDIDCYAEEFVRDFQPEAFSIPMEFNIDLFVEEYLGLTVDYQYLSCDQRFLGMTIFNDTNKIVVYNPEYHQADYISARAGTIIIDKNLLRTNQEHRYRYTMGHESAHWIFHRAYYGYNPNQDAKVLVGATSKQHGLPDFAHSPNSKYIKENRDGSFRELRDYDETGFPIIEIGYHPEPSLTGNRNTNVLHFHTFKPDLERVMGGIVSETSNPTIYEKYKKYLKEYGL